MSTQLKFNFICALICLSGFMMCKGCRVYDYKLRKWVCCKYYLLDEFSRRCKPICTPSCTNSNCIKPGVCRCYGGYTADPLNDHNCLPICEEECSNGACISPNVCECNHGYKNIGSKCTPVCTEPCNNGTCISPENCLCNSGYRMSEKMTCEPYCSTGCNDGRCVGPELCACDAGWIPVNSNTCKPTCSPSCFNGVCVAPNKCKCKPGYEISTYSFAAWNYTCLPHTTTTTTIVSSIPAELYSTSTTAITPLVPDTSTKPYSTTTTAITSLVPDISTKPYSTTTTTTINSSVPYTSIKTTKTSMPFTLSTKENVVRNSSMMVPTEISIVNKTEFVVGNVSISFTTEIPEEKESQEIWIYLTVCLAILLVATLLILAIVFRSKLLSCIKQGGSYVVEDQKPKSTQESFNVTFSSIANK